MSVPWSSKGTKATPVDADQLMIIDSEDAAPGTTNKLITIGTLPSGDVSGPTGATDEAITRFDGTTGKLIQGGIITIDDNANAQLIRSLQFVSHTAAPPSTVEYIAVVNNDFEINVTNGNNFKLEVDENVEYQYDATQADFNSNNLLMGEAYTQYTSITSPGVTGDAATGRLFLDSANSNVLSIIRNGIVIDLEASGEFFTWTADHSMAAFKLTASAANDVILNAPTGQGVSIEVTGSERYLFEMVQANFFGNNLVGVGNVTLTAGGTLTIPASAATGFMDMGEITTPANPAANIGRLYVKDVSTVTTLFFRDSAGVETDLLAVGTQTPWLSDIDADGFDLTDLGNIEFRDPSASTPAATVNYIHVLAAGMSFNTVAGNSFQMLIAGAQEYVFSTAELSLLNKNIDFGSSQRILQGGGFTFEVPTASDFDFEINSVVEYKFATGAADFNGNDIQDIPNILDSNGNQLLTFTTTASAVNELTLVNAATASAVELQASGDDTNVDVRFVPKGTGTFYGNRETFAWPLTDETSLPTTGVKYTTEPAPYDMSMEDAVAGLTTAGTGGVQATGTVTCLSVLVGDTVTVNGLLYTGVTGAKADNTEFSVDSGDNATATDLADSITNDTRTGTDETTVDQTAIDTANLVTITASVFGIIGNNVGLSSSDGGRLAVSGANLAGGIDLFTIDVLKEDGVNSDSFTSIFSTLPTIDSSEFTSTTATATPVLSVTTWEKGRRLQLKIDTLDINTLGRGAKIELICHATAK